MSETDKEGRLGKLLVEQRKLSREIVSLKQTLERAQITIANLITCADHVPESAGEEAFLNHSHTLTGMNVNVAITNFVDRVLRQNGVNQEISELERTG